MPSRFALFTGAVAVTAWMSGLSAQEHNADAQTNAAAAKMVNPAKATPASIAAGKKIFDAQCANCHGTTGKGDGKMAAAITGAKPSDLTDAESKHGSSDGEIFTIIRDGSKGTGMRGFASRMKTDDIWNVVNYLRTLAPKPIKSHW